MSQEEIVLDQHDLTTALSHVLWIAGSLWAGKSTIGHTIARIYVFLDYHFDPMERNHILRRLAQGDACIAAFLKMSLDQRWLERPLEVMVQETIESWTKRFGLVVEDLLAMSRDPWIVAEGIFFPACLAPYLSSPCQAIWPVPSVPFTERVRRQRHVGGYRGTSDPERALRNLIDRDCRLARYVKQQAEERHLPYYEVHESRSLDKMTALVEKHFEPYIVERFDQMQHL